MIEFGLPHFKGMKENVTITALVSGGSVYDGICRLVQTKPCHRIVGAPVERGVWSPATGRYAGTGSGRGSEYRPAGQPGPSEGFEASGTVFVLMLSGLAEKILSGTEGSLRED
ncbi:ribosomal small subunit Rsm22 [Methylocaldum marinum]|uniref:Ribosomal small subunit Rsm22 n=1 Tax=Methylocaldum marinum TaxID=1432792 RepID=A0A286P3T3_9GAMM|nr:ribosomal small subunit Rsm22 [Methylocaldum marinum]